MEYPKKPKKIDLNLEDLEEDESNKNDKIEIDDLQEETRGDTLTITSENLPSNKQKKLTIEADDLPDLQKSKRSTSCPRCGAKLLQHPSGLYCPQCNLSQAREDDNCKREQKRNGTKLTVAALLAAVLIAVPASIYLYTSEDENKVTKNVESESSPLEVALDDGTGVDVPAQGLPQGTLVTVQKLDPEKAPVLPEGFSGVVKLYDISADDTLQGEVKVRVATPEVGEESLKMLFRYNEGNWEPMPFEMEDGYVVVEADSLSLWGWLSVDVPEFGNKIEEFVMTYADADIVIEPLMSWFKDFTGLKKYDGIALESSSPEIEIDESDARDLLSVSARVVEEDKVRIRVRNEANFYLHLAFENQDKLDPQRGSYLDLKSIMEIGELARIMTYRDVLPTSERIEDLLEEVASEDVLLLPEGTAEFYSKYAPGENLIIEGDLSDVAAFYSSLDPLMGFVPLADIEMIAAVRDIKGEGSRVASSLYDMEKCFKEEALELTGLREALYSGAVLFGEKALKTAANLLVVPLVVDIRKDLLEGRAMDVLDKGSVAMNGSKIVVNYKDLPKPEPESEREPEPDPEPEPETVSSYWFCGDCGKTVEGDWSEKVRRWKTCPDCLPRWSEPDKEYGPWEYASFLCPRCGKTAKSDWSEGVPREMLCSDCGSESFHKHLEILSPWE